MAWKENRYLFAVFLFTLLFMLLSVPFAGNKVDAATALDEIEITTPYIVTDAVQYKDKTFIIGRDVGTDREQMKVVVREGDLVETVIPASELGKTADYEDIWPIILQETDQNLYIEIMGDGTLSVVYIIDKNTNKYKKKTGDQLFEPFKQMIEEAGYDASKFLLSSDIYFQGEEAVWAVAQTSVSYAEETQGTTLVLNKEFGVVKAFEDYEVYGSYYELVDSFAFDQQGSLYYEMEHDENNHQLVKIDRNGVETTYSIPSDFTLTVFSVNNKSNLMNGFIKYNIPGAIYAYNAVLTIEGGQVKLLNAFFRLSNFQFDEDGRFWLNGRDENSNDALGYLDDSFEPKFLFATEGMFSGFDVYNGTIFYYNEEGYGYSVLEDLVDDEEEPENNKRGWVMENNTWYFFNENGEKVTNWLEVDGKWYYFAADGAMAENKWVQSGSTWYFLGKGGAMLTNSWVQDGAWYYLNKDGVMVENAWVQSGSAWYYMGK
ncbi:hypothetical protein V7112_15545, partial [Bacillus sp. JJ1566]